MNRTQSRTNKMKIGFILGLIALPLSAHVPFSARMNGGRIHFREGRYERAREQFELALKERPNSAEANFWLGLALAQLEEAPNAAPYFLKAFQLDSNYINLSKKEEWKKFAVWNALSQKTQRLILENRYEEALPYAEKATVIDEKRPLGYTLLAQVYSQMNKLEELRHLSQELIKGDSLSPQGYNILGMYFFTQEIWDSAATTYQKAGRLYERRLAEYKENLKKEIKGTEPEAAIERLLAYQRNKDVSGFRSYVEDSLRLKPKLSLFARLTLEFHNTALEKNFAYFRAGASYLQKSSGDVPESVRIEYLRKAEDAFNTVLAYNPKDWDAKYNLGFIKYSLGEEKIEEAEAIFKEMASFGMPLAQLPKDFQERVDSVIKSAGKQVSIPLPPEITQKLPEGNLTHLYLFDTLSPFLSPFEPQTLENIYTLLGASQIRIADSKGAKEKYDEAILSFRRVISLNPKSLDAYQNLVVAYREKGDKKTAESLYVKMQRIKREER